MISDFNLFPPVTVVVCTYNRLNELSRTLAALDSNLFYPARRDKIRFIIADDCSPDPYIKNVGNLPIWKRLGEPGYSVTSKNSGWAVNVNGALAHVDTDFVFFIEDDYILKKPLNLGAGVALMLSTPHLGMLRYRGTAGDQVVFHQLEADVSTYLPDHQDGVGLPGKLTYFQLDSGSPALYLYSHGAHLKRRSFHQFYGPYPTGLKLGHTEESYAHIVKDKMRESGAPGIAILPDWVPMWFDHIGQSYQLTEADKEYVNG